MQDGTGEAEGLLECDLVMKGGITSGVVYPLALVELARRYRFRSVGGSSAGAIAAAAAVAAEYGRQTGATAPGSGFAGLAALPASLGERLPGGGSRLSSLFQPTRRTRPVLDALLGAARGGSAAGKVAGAAAPLVLASPGRWVALAGLLLAGAVGALATRQDGLAAAAALWLSAAAVLGLAALGAAAASAVSALGAIADNGLGVCSGFAPPGGGGPPPLTAWLHGLVQTLAGTREVLTLGHLERHGLRLEVTTTSVTHQRPFRLPLHPDDPVFFFREAEFRALFPGEVVDRLVEAGRAEEAERRARTDGRRVRLPAHDPSLVLFPRGPGLPVLVLARMSLSFPLLLGAVPLHGVDWTRRRNQRRRAEPELERAWFSDGGICSNIPIHFFDAALPTRPTFAIDLRAQHPDHPLGAWLPANNASGIAQRWHRLGAGRAAPLRFLAAVVTTMQTWVDEMQLTAPGYRDRIVHVSHAADEGGLNLEMPPEVIARLAARGADAGVRLRDRFRWDDHRWIRFRSLLDVMQRYVAPAWAAHAPGTPGRAALLELLEAHRGGRGSYPVTGPQADCARAALEGVDRLVDAAAATGGDLRERAPRPAPELRARPRV
ncbi:SuhR protein [Anaeromyxobacter sp. Red801]|uniref:SuhR protein n=1 Tax=Anaeromyxobacter sp. Red801 TaxID=3411632 RepID=UPI003B9DFBBE